MLNSVRSKQLTIIFAMLLLVGFLFTRKIKGLVEPKGETGQESATTGTASSPSLSIDEVSSTAKNLISDATAKEITLLEGNFKAASGNEQVAGAKQLAQKWDDVEQAAPSAMYLEIVAKGEPNLSNWNTAGTRFLKAFDTTQDSLLQPVMLQKANNAFKSALAIDSTNLDAKTGLGITIVNGMGAPMSGIFMLREVVAKDPKNFKANMNLGMFAIKSGQFDKAIIRFTDIINTIKATPDAYLYLASANESLGKNKEAIDAYLSAKKLAANPTLSKWIDEQVVRLKK